MSQRESAAARTRKVRAVVGPGPHINSTPSSHTAYGTTVHTSRTAEVADQLKRAFPDAQIAARTGFVSLWWSESDDR